MAIPLRDDLPTKRVPWVTLTLIALNVIVFFWIQPTAAQYEPSTDRGDYSSEYQRAVDNSRFTYEWGGVSCEILSGERLADAPEGCDAYPANEVPGSASQVLDRGKSVYLALLTLMFLHGSVAHIARNMLFLWVFGNNVEDRLGPLLYLGLYLVGGVIGTLGFALANAHSSVPLVGASGAIAAAMGAYLVFHPRERILTFVGAFATQLVYVPAAVVLVLFFVTQFLVVEDQVAWEAHAVGMGAGALIALAMMRLPSVRARRQRTETERAVRTGSAF